MNNPPDRPQNLSQQLRRWAVPGGAYAAIVSVSVAAAATLVFETLPLTVTAL